MTLFAFPPSRKKTTTTSSPIPIPSTTTKREEKPDSARVRVVSAMLFATFILFFFTRQVCFLEVASRVNWNMCAGMQGAHTYMYGS